MTNSDRWHTRRAYGRQFLDMRNAPEYTFGTGLNDVHSIFGHGQMAYDDL
ncbi:MAG: hypothetical protein IPG64_22045 [Haliea sp.]|nr:hypothetical protein [Haliea sp.]